MFRRPSLGDGGDDDGDGDDDGGDDDADATISLV